MTRSDMIQTIVYHALSWSGLDTSGVPLEEIADDMLKVVERNGMLPPMYIAYPGVEDLELNEWEYEE